MDLRRETQRQPAWQGDRSGFESAGCMLTYCPVRRARPSQPDGLAVSRSRKAMKHPG